MSNKVCSSKFNGILVMGQSGVSPCSPLIKKNQIDNNRKAGIKVCEGARAEITEKNTIEKNYNQGVLITEGSSAKVISNIIQKNLKANVAFGGEGSGRT